MKLPLLIVEMNGIFSLIPGKTQNNFAQLANVLQKVKGTGYSLPIMMVNNNYNRYDKFFHERYLTQQFNDRMGGPLLSDSNFVLPYSHLRETIKIMSDKQVLLVGNTNLKQIAQNEGIFNYLTLDEYVEIFPKNIPIGNSAASQDSPVQNDFISLFSNKKGHESKEDKYKIDAVLVLDVPLRFENHVQVICDLLSTPDGKVAKQFDHSLTTHIPIYWTQNYQKYKQDGQNQQIDLGFFKDCLNIGYKYLYQRDLNVHSHLDSNSNSMQYLLSQGEQLPNVDMEKVFWVTAEESLASEEHKKAGIETVLLEKDIGETLSRLLAI